MRHLHAIRFDFTTQLLSSSAFAFATFVCTIRHKPQPVPDSNNPFLASRLRPYLVVTPRVSMASMAVPVSRSFRPSPLQESIGIVWP